MAKKLTANKAKEILRHGEVHDKPLTPKQKRYMGYVAGGGKAQTGGWLDKYQTGGEILKKLFATDYSDEESKDKAYVKARSKGKEFFRYNNKLYNTKYKGTQEEQLKETGITDEIISNNPVFGSKLRERIAKNILPRDYGHTRSALRSILLNEPEYAIDDRMVNTIIPSKSLIDSLTQVNKNVPYYFRDYNISRSEIDSLYNTKGTSGEFFDSHIDALNLTMGFPQRTNTFGISSYKPTISKDNNVTYYKLNNDRVKDIVLSNYSKLKDKSSAIISSNDAETSALGDYTISKGEDEKGKYVSYYDINDYAPSGSYKFQSEKQANAVLPIGKPFEIYDRIYYRDDGGSNNIIRQYYSDDELREMNLSEFNPKHLQKELYNRGYDLTNSKLYNVNIGHYESEYLPEETIKKYEINEKLKNAGEGGTNIVMSDKQFQEFKKEYKDGYIKSVKERYKDYINNPGIYHQEYGDKQNFIEKYIQPELKDIDDPKKRKKLTDYYIKAFDNESKKDSYNKFYKDAMDNFRIWHDIDFDGVIGDETIEALEKYKSDRNKQKNFKQGGYLKKSKEITNFTDYNSGWLNKYS